MDQIWIQKIEATENGWRVYADVGQPRGEVLDYVVEVDRDYWQEIATKRTVEELIRGTFRFLLAREPKESILRKFNLRSVQKYFPDFEKSIKKELSL